MKMLFICLFMAVGLNLYSNNIELEKIFEVIKEVESNNRAKSIGDGGKAFGVVQIHEGVIKDVNMFYGTNYEHKDAFNVVCSKEIFKLYLSKGIDLFVKKTGKYPTEEDVVRMWNGGCYSGYKRESTLKYLKRYKYWKNLLSLKW